jgi:hypothetical protein
MATQIKITELGSIDNANLTSTTLFPAVNMVGTPLTQKATLQQIGNVILSGAGGANFAAAGLANIAYSVVNAAQPNITSVGTLTTLAVTGNITIGGGNVATKSTTGYNVARATTVTVDNIIARVSSDGKGQVSVVTGSVTVTWSGYEILSGIQAAFNNTGISVSSGVWQDVSASLMSGNGDTIITTVQADNHIYRISFVQTTNIANATTIVEKLL